MGETHDSKPENNGLEHLRRGLGAKCWLFSDPQHQHISWHEAGAFNLSTSLEEEVWRLADSKGFLASRPGCKGEHQVQ